MFCRFLTEKDAGVSAGRAGASRDPGERYLDYVVSTWHYHYYVVYVHMGQPMFTYNLSIYIIVRLQWRDLYRTGPERTNLPRRARDSRSKRGELLLSKIPTGLGAQRLIRESQAQRTRQASTAKL